MPVVTNPWIDAAVAKAKSLPDLVTALQTADPDLATALTTKSLVVSRTPYAVAVATALATLSTSYGLGWSNQFDAVLSGAIVIAVTFVASALMRLITSQPIGGVFSAPATKPPSPSAVAAGLAAFAASQAPPPDPAPAPIFPRPPVTG